MIRAAVVIRCGVIAFGTVDSATWMVRGTTRSSGLASIMIDV